MPKVIFRPNPVPPPFPPPTPSYDTTSTIKVYPFPFESGSDTSFQLPSLNVPSYTFFRIFQFNPDLGIYVGVSDDISEQVSQPLSSSFTSEIDSFANNDFELRFFDEDNNIVWSIKATRID